MKHMSSLDASILALIADTIHSARPGHVPPQVRQHLSQLARQITDEELRSVADVLISGEQNLQTYSGSVQSTVRELRSWAARNRRVHAPTEQKSLV
jgi:hypothetical protein